MARKAKAQETMVENAAGGPPHPRQCVDLVGHGRGFAAFEEAVVRGRPAQSWLITGGKGIGKASFAYHLARRVLGMRRNGGVLPPVPEVLSPLFRRVTEASHTDLRSVEPEALGKDINVEAIREVQHFLHLTPAEGDWRVVIIDAADDMNDNAANALLKLLEEPPAGAMLFLLSHMPGRLLPTIRSRCRTLPLAPLSMAEWEQVVGRVVQLAPDEARMLKVLSQGSPGVALMLHEYGAHRMYGLVLEALKTPAGGTKRLAMAEEMAKDADAWGAVEQVMGRVTSALVEVAATGALREEAVPGEAEILAGLARGRALDYWEFLWENTQSVLADQAVWHFDRRHVITDWVQRI